MRFASLGSGSKGNCLIVEEKNTRLLLDCGFSTKVITAPDVKFVPAITIV